MQTETSSLHKGLNAFHLWGIAVGLVISGEYFGWSYGWASAGTLGFLITTMAVAAMYVAFIFSFTELTTAIPQAGGRCRRPEAEWRSACSQRSGPGGMPRPTLRRRQEDR